jgi:hypothetical protein
MAQRIRFGALQVDGGQLGADQLDVGGSAVADSLTLPAATATLAPMGLTRLESGNLPSDVQVPSKRAVDAAAASLVPIGTVVLWFGSTANVPDGWEIYEAAAGAFVMGSDADHAPGEAQGADGGASAAMHTVPVPLPRHGHSVADAGTTVTTSSNAHSHRFRERTIGNMKSGDLEFANSQWQGGRVSMSTTRTHNWVVGREQQLMQGGVVPYGATPFGFLAPSPQPFWQNTTAAQNQLHLRGSNNTGGVPGVIAGATGRHTHTVSGRHTHPTEAAGTNAPTIDIQPAYRTLHYIRKVREPVFQD